jgi:hypothetical protein
MLGLQQRGLPGEAAMAMASSAAFTIDAVASTSGEAPPSREVQTNPSIFCFVFQVLLFLFFFVPSFLVHDQGSMECREGFYSLLCDICISAYQETW